MRIGLPELAVVFLIGIIILSPRDMLRLARDAGRYWERFSSFYRDFKRYLRNLEFEIERELSTNEKDESQGVKKHDIISDNVIPEEVDIIYPKREVEK